MRKSVREREVKKLIQKFESVFQVLSNFILLQCFSAMMNARGVSELNGDP
jgi:hypothetical protein